MPIEILIPGALFLLLMGGITWYGYARYARAGQAYGEIATEDSGPIDSGTETSGLVRIIQSIGEQVPVSPEDVSMTRRYLIAAGYRSDSAIPIYSGLRICFVAILVLFVAGSSFVAISNPGLRMIPILFSVVFGFYIPGLVLERMIVSRQEELRLSLPDALDLMVVCVEAGVGLDQAIQNVARELKISHREIAEELSLVNLEMRAGKRRAEALRNLADRTGEAELRKLVAIMLQTDRFGTSMAEGLRTHSDFMRVRRRQDAEERAGKVGVKLVFPIFFLILPSMLVVAAGPGMLQVFKHLFPMMREFRI